MIEEARQREVRVSAAPERLVKLRGGNKEMGSSRGEQVSASPITGASELMRRRQEASAASRVASPASPQEVPGGRRALVSPTPWGSASANRRGL